jgi:exonuclease SbcD
MRVLHSSDWHLGKRLEQFSRLEEQRQVLDEIVRIAEEKAVDLVLIAGDLFDSYNPPVEAEELFYSTLKRLSARGTRPVVAIAGNHDSPDAVQAPDPLARLHGIVLLGYPGSYMRELTSEGGVVMRFLAPGLLELLLPAEKSLPPVRILTAPYANERRLRKLFQRLDAGADDEGAESEGGTPDVMEVMNRLFEYWRNLGEEFFSEDTINIVAAHLFCMPARGSAGAKDGDGSEGSDGSDSPGASVQTFELEEPEEEKPILYPGGLSPVPSNAFPAGSQYVALGHLHRPQEVTGEAFAVAYCGSPLAYSRSEASQQKYVYCVDIEAGKMGKVEKIPLTGGRKILRHRSSGVDEAVDWLRAHSDSYVELTVETESYLSSTERRRIYEAHSRILSVIPELTGEAAARPDMPVDTDKPIVELFADYFSAEYGGGEPPKDLLDLFREVLAYQEGSK